MNDVSTFRLYLMRVLYLLIAVGLGCTIWPATLHEIDARCHATGGRHRRDHNGARDALRRGAIEGELQAHVAMVAR